MLNCIETNKSLTWRFQSLQEFQGGIIMAKEKFDRTKKADISQIKVNPNKSKGEFMRDLISTIEAGRKIGKELGLEEADFSKYDEIDSSKEI